MTQYEPVIGLEIHGELLTNSKMFCSCSADYGSAPEPNTNICPTCTGLPGAMPVVNKKATELAALVGLALKCSVNKHNTFARKNYYYPDLPKGYQISQYELPICEKGYLEVNVDGEEQFKVRVRRVHIEEDTAKLSHEKNYALVDFNRAGVPLLEIVSEPDMRSVEAALDYATKVRAILRYLGVNSGDMEKGVLRFEANISVRPVGSDEFRTRTEIKNLNSFRALTRASAYEIERQIKVYELGGERGAGNARLGRCARRDDQPTVEGRRARLSLLPRTRPAATATFGCVDRCDSDSTARTARSQDRPLHHGLQPDSVRSAFSYIRTCARRITSRAWSPNRKVQRKPSIHGSLAT